MKLKPIDALFVVGLLLAILPWLILDQSDWLPALIFSSMGAILLTVARADALTSMWGWGDSGNDFLIDLWRRVQRTYRKIFASKDEEPEGTSSRLDNVHARAKKSNSDPDS